MSESNELKSVVSVTAMAKMVGLSRSRFYQLIGTAFPKPQYGKETGRPFYDEDQQQVCLDVRRRNCGIDGKPILFYAKGHRAESPRRAKKPARPTTRVANQHADLIESLGGLGLDASASQVSETLTELFPSGISGVDEAEVTRSVFLHLQRKNSSDNVER